MDRGWFKVWRKIEDSQVFSDNNLFKVWIWCLMRANHKKTFVPVQTGTGNTIVEVGRGQFIFGRKKAAKALKMKPHSVYNRMQKLKSFGNLNIQTNTHYSIVTICNYEDYQALESSGEQAGEQAENNQRTCREQPENTDKNEENEKNDKKKTPKPPRGVLSDEGSLLKSAYPDFRLSTDAVIMKTVKLIKASDKTVDFAITRIRIWEKSDQWLRGMTPRLGKFFAEGTWLSDPPGNNAGPDNATSGRNHPGLVGNAEGW